MAEHRWFLLGLFFVFPAIAGEWSPPINLSQNSGASVFPHIAVGDVGQLHVVWSDRTLGGQNPYYRRSNGGVWGPTTNLGTSTWEQSVRVCVDRAGRVHVGWDANYDSIHDWDIYHRVFEGNTWSPAVPVAQTPNRSVDIALAAVPGGVFAAWEDGNAPDPNQTQHYCFGRRWNVTWGALVDISGSGRYDVQQYVDPDVAADTAGNIHVIYALRMNPGDSNKLHDIWYRRFNGTSWETPVNLSNGPVPSWSQAAHIALDPAGRPHVAFVSDLGGGLLSQYYVAWDGSRWSSPLKISNNSDEVGRCDIAVDPSGTVHVVWMERPGEILHRSKSAGNWSSIRNVTSNPSWSDAPVLDVDALGTLHLVYHDDATGNWEVYYRYLDTVNLPTRTPTGTFTPTATPTVTVTPTHTNTPRNQPTATPTPSDRNSLLFW